ncbi:MAG: 3'(2'),5'-bisphosphate nucleotidase CysQ [Bacteroidota bacterium]
MNYTNLIEQAIVASIHAGVEILKVYDGEIIVEIKDDRSPLTEADKRSNTAIVEHLGTSLPILSEEGKTIDYSERKDWELFWLVDPLDGTKEFIKRNGEFTVNIALIKNQTPVGGVIYAPVINDLYFSIENMGAFKINSSINELLQLVSVPNFISALIAKASKLPLATGNRLFTVVASRSHMSEETTTFIEELKSKHGEINLISKGSSLKLCLVAEGAAEVYPRFAPTMEWDTAAGHAIALGAGLTVRHTDSNHPLIYNKENLLNPWFVVE